MNGLNVLQWPSQSPDLNLIEDLWRDLKMVVHWHSPIQADERVCKEEWEKLPKKIKNRWAELVASYLERPEAVIAATKYWTKVIDTNVLFYIFENICKNFNQTFPVCVTRSCVQNFKVKRKLDPCWNKAVTWLNVKQVKCCEYSLDILHVKREYTSFRKVENTT